MQPQNYTTHRNVGPLEPPDAEGYRYTKCLDCGARLFLAPGYNSLTPEDLPDMACEAAQTMNAIFSEPNDRRDTPNA